MEDFERKFTHFFSGGDISRGITDSRAKATGSLSPNDNKDIRESDERTLHSAQESADSKVGVEGNDHKTASNAGKEESLDLQGLIYNYLSKECLTGQNRYRCDNCASLQDAEQQHYFSSCPKYLVLTLKRFTYDMSTHTRSKILKNVHYPLNLAVPVNAMVKESKSAEDVEMEDNSEYPTASATTTPDCTPMKRTRSDSPEAFIKLEKPDKLVMSLVSENCKHYSLVAVIVHSGVSSESGHYYCYSRERLSASGTNKTTSSSPPPDVPMNCSSSFSTDSENSRRLEPFKDDNHWYIFNDSNVSFAGSRDVQNLHINFPRDTPYVFIYEEVDAAQVSSTTIESLRPEIALAVRSDNRQFLEVCTNHFVYRKYVDKIST